MEVHSCEIRGCDGNASGYSIQGRSESISYLCKKCLNSMIGHGFLVKAETTKKRKHISYTYRMQKNDVSFRRITHWILGNTGPIPKKMMIDIVAMIIMHLTGDCKFIATAENENRGIEVLKMLATTILRIGVNEAIKNEPKFFKQERKHGISIIPKYSVAERKFLEDGHELFQVIQYDELQNMDLLYPMFDKEELLVPCSASCSMRPVIDLNLHDYEFREHTQDKAHSNLTVFTKRMRIIYRIFYDLIKHPVYGYIWSTTYYQFINEYVLQPADPHVDTYAGFYLREEASILNPIAFTQTRFYRWHQKMQKCQSAYNKVREFPLEYDTIGKTAIVALAYYFRNYQIMTSDSMLKLPMKVKFSGEAMRMTKSKYMAMYTNDLNNEKYSLRSSWYPYSLVDLKSEKNI